MAGFFQALQFTLEAEGGFVVDNGGPTMQGVTQATFDSWRRRHNLPSMPVAQIQEDERDAIYHQDYWLAAKCEKLPWPLSMVHFDHAVNSGPAQAIRTLQRAVGVKPDGHWGPDTQKAVGHALAYDTVLFRDLLLERLEFLYSLALMDPTTHHKSLKGWLRRVFKLRRRALELW